MIFTDADGKIIEELTEAHLDCLQSTEVTHRLQKNRRNNQKLNFSADNNNKDLCFCRNAAQIVLRAKRLGQSDDLPLAIYKNSKQSSFKYLTSRKVTEYLRKATRLAHPDWPKEKVNMIGIHSIRVFALVLLSEANKPSWFMKARLRLQGLSAAVFTDYWLVIFNLTREIQCLPINGQRKTTTKRPPIKRS